LPEALAAVGAGRIDLVLECSGAAAAIDAALRVVKRGGGMTLVGMPSVARVEVDLAEALRIEVALRPSYFGSWSDFERAIGLIANGTVPADALLVPYALDDVLSAFSDASRQQVLKPVVRP
jgi:threonine dehydrogenase-like Zn-dependent dehydrogenase